MTPGSPPPAEERLPAGRRRGLFLGTLGFAVVLALPAPADLSPAGWRTAAVALLMAVWWITEAIPIPATAMLPLVLLPALGILDMKAAAAPYANDLIFLQMGGFLLALAIERWGLHRRMALAVVAAVGGGPRRLVLGVMLAAAFLSMWISNTATTALMLPIVMAVVSLLRPADRRGPFELGVCLLLGLAYAATIGGVTTLIGTPPNAVLAAQASELLGREIGFLEWMAIGVPLAALLLPLVWFLLTTWLYPPGDLRGDAQRVIAAERSALGPVSRGERTVAVVFGLTASAWILRAPKDLGGWTLPGIQSFAPAIRDSTIAVAAAVALFLIPVDFRRGVFALDWHHAKRIPWGVLVLFGGGLSLAHAMAESGLAAWIGAHVSGLRGLPTWLVVTLVAALFVFLTEITSNVATATMAMPIMAGAATGLGIAPLALMATAALSASMAFMLPVATPPNAIVFGSGEVSIRQMLRAGLALNLLAIVAISLVTVLLVPAILG